MKQYSVIIAEDSHCDMDILSNLVAGRNELKLTGKAVDGGDAIRLLCKKSFDLIFLDIDMPVYSGFDVLRLSGKSVPPQIIITTAYPDFAVEAFDREVLDFLVKPFTINRFNRAIDRFLERISSEDKDKQRKKTSSIVSISGKGYRYLINLDDIIYISSHGRKSILHCNKSDKVVPMLMNDVHGLLPESRFVRVHKQHIINILYIDLIKTDFTGRHKILLNDEDDTSLPVGRIYLKNLRAIMDG